MRTWRVTHYFGSGFYRRHLSRLLFACSITFIASCAKTVNVYYPPRLDLAQYGRVGMIVFSDNARPSVGEYATQQFQNRIQSAQLGIPIVELGSEKKVLKSIGSDQLDLKAMQKIGRAYNVSAVFVGSVVYSDIKTDVNLADLAELKASVNTTLNGTLSVKLIETDGGATIWSNSTSWKRKLGNINMSESTGIAVGTSGYSDAYKKLIPDMVNDVTRDFRGRYIRKRVDG